MRRLAFVVGSLAAIVACLAAMRPASAGAHTPELVQADPVDSTATASPGPTPRSAIEPLPGLEDGSTVQIQLPPVYSSTPIVPRLAATLNSLPHGPEMSSLRIALVDRNGLLQSCGGASSCYLQAEQTMVVPGDPDSLNLPMPFEMTVAHEYGHHLAANRSSAGWSGSQMGAPHWATYEHVCPLVRAGRLFPGDQGAHYWENPGEAFAQTYAFMAYPNAVPWWWAFAKPDAGAYQAIQADISDPSVARSWNWSGRLSPGKSRAVTSISPGVDGWFRATIRQPKGARFTMRVSSSDGASTTAQGHKRSLATADHQVCGGGEIRLKVQRRAGKGRFQVRLSRI